MVVLWSSPLEELLQQSRWQIVADLLDALLGHPSNERARDDVLRNFGGIVVVDSLDDVLCHCRSPLFLRIFSTSASAISKLRYRLSLMGVR